MTDLLDIARQTILAPAGMVDDDLNKILDNTLGNAIDSADVYFQLQRHESWVMEDGIVKEGSYNIDQGVGQIFFQTTVCSFQIVLKHII